VWLTIKNLARFELFNAALCSSSRPSSFPPLHPSGRQKKIRLKTSAVPRRPAADGTYLHPSNNAFYMMPSYYTAWGTQQRAKMSVPTSQDPEYSIHCCRRSIYPRARAQSTSGHPVVSPPVPIWQLPVNWTSCWKADTPCNNGTYPAPIHERMATLGTRATTGKRRGCTWHWRNQTVKVSTGAFSDHSALRPGCFPALS